MRTVLWLTLGLIGWLASAGLVQGADEFQPDNEGFIRNWLVLGPLFYGNAENGAEALGKEPIKDEAKLAPKLGDKTKVSTKDFDWVPVKTESHIIDFIKSIGEFEDCIGFAVCHVIADAEMKDLKIKMGSDDQAKVYLNGKEVVKHDGDGRGADKDQNTGEGVTLNKGVNVIVFKIVNGSGGWGGCLRFTDKDNKPITNIKVSLKP